MIGMSCVEWTLFARGDAFQHKKLHIVVCLLTRHYILAVRTVALCGVKKKLQMG